MSHPAVFRPLQAKFLTIPQTPLCYWLRDRFFELLAGRTLGERAKIVQQVITAENARFLHFFWELQDATGTRLGYLKAGGFARWSGLDRMLFDWRDGGVRVKNAIIAKYQYLQGNWSWLIKTETFFKPGWTYTLMARGCMGARKLEPGYVCDSASPTLIPEPPHEGYGAILNCRASSPTSAV